MSQRSCGTCTLCCKTHGIAELKKPEHQWCDHANVGRGCAIYGVRPNECRRFNCAWIDGQLEEDDNPERLGVVFSSTICETGQPLFVASESYSGRLQGRRAQEIVQAAARVGPILLSYADGRFDRIGRERFTGGIR